MHKIYGRVRRKYRWKFIDQEAYTRVMKKANKKRNPVARQLRHFKQKVIKNKKVYERKNIRRDS